MEDVQNAELDLSSNYDKVLLFLCECNVSIMCGWHPVSAPHIAKALSMSVGSVRYRLRKLKNQGLVYSFYEGGMSEDADVFCYWGWGVTEKAHKTQEYKKAHEEEREICKKIFDIDIGEAK